jgi:hypothetical protein
VAENKPIVSFVQAFLVKVAPWQIGLTNILCTSADHQCGVPEQLT